MCLDMGVQQFSNIIRHIFSVFLRFLYNCQHTSRKEQEKFLYEIRKVLIDKKFSSYHHSLIHYDIIIVIVTIIIPSPYCNC